MTETLATRKPLTGYHLKLIALITMFIDHIGFVFFPQVHALRVIGRVSFPIYAFLIAEGCRYSHDRTLYALRLGLFALISEIPYDLALYPDYFKLGGLGRNFFEYTNVFYTLCMGVAAIQLFETLRRRSRKAQLAAVGGTVGFFVLLILLNIPNLLLYVPFVWFVGPVYVLALLWWCRWMEQRSGKNAWEKPGWLSNVLAFIPILLLLWETEVFMSSYGAFGVFIIFLVFLPKRRWMQCAVLALGMFYHYGWDALNTLLKGRPVLDGSYVLAKTVVAVAAAVLIYFAYNGQRGKKAKWGFYAAYPAHLAILAAIRAVLKV